MGTWTCRNAARSVQPNPGLVSEHGLAIQNARNAPPVVDALLEESLTMTAPTFSRWSRCTTSRIVSVGWTGAPAPPFVGNLHDVVPRSALSASPDCVRACSLAKIRDCVSVISFARQHLRNDYFLVCLAKVTSRAMIGISGQPPTFAAAMVAICHVQESNCVRTNRPRQRNRRSTRRRLTWLHCGFAAN